MSGSFRLLSVDPGKATGYGWAFIERGRLVSVQFSELPFQRFHEEIDKVLRSWPADTHRIDVYCERFVIGSETHRKVKGSNPYWSIETTGYLRAVCGITGHHFETQSTSDAKGNQSDKRLKAIGWWIKGDEAQGIDGSHARDAAKHMLLALQRHHRSVYFDLVK